MKIAKTALVIAIGTLITFFFVSSTLAGGWHKIGVKEGNAANTQNPDAGLWASESGGDANKVPHLDLATSSNKCRTCHAVHSADNVGKGLGADSLTTPDPQVGPELTGNGQSFKLLRNESRKTECFFCHWTEGALTSYKKKPFAPLMVDTNFDGTPETEVPAKGEHTLGALQIPDSTVDQTFLQGDGLQCGICHSVHGGWTLNGVAAAGTLNTRILRRDPAQNGNGSQGQGAAGGVINVQDIDANNKPINPGLRAGETYPGSTQLNKDQIIAAFCGDCHNKNVNWDRGGAGAINWDVPPGNEGERPNKYGHPIGNVDELIDVYGKLKQVAQKMWTDYLTCDVCHASRVSDVSKFPHQSTGYKLLDDNYTIVTAESPLDKVGKYEQWLKPWDTAFHPGKTNAFTGDPDRPLPALQQNVCMACHGPYVGKPDDPNSF